MVLDYSLSYPILCHHTKEDLVYRRLRTRDAAATDAIGDLEADHEELATLTRRFAVTFDSGPRTISRYRLIRGGSLRRRALDM